MARSRARRAKTTVKTAAKAAARSAKAKTKARAKVSMRRARATKATVVGEVTALAGQLKRMARKVVRKSRNRLDLEMAALRKMGTGTRRRIAKKISSVGAHASAAAARH